MYLLRRYLDPRNACLITPVPEHVPARSELPAHQRFVVHLEDFRARARLRGDAGVGLGGDFHLSTRETDLLLHKTYIAFIEPAIRPGPNGVRIKVDRSVELLHHSQGETRIAWIPAGSFGAPRVITVVKIDE